MMDGQGKVIRLMIMTENEHEQNERIIITHNLFLSNIILVELMLSADRLIGA